VKAAFTAEAIGYGKRVIAVLPGICVPNRSDEWIGRELGMEPDEVLRLRQVSGLAELFTDREFSEAWEAG
jgi:hypothetical protein